jgi:hypothetical protein
MDRIRRCLGIIVIVSMVSCSMTLEKRQDKWPQVVVEGGIKGCKAKLKTRRAMYDCKWKF